MDEQRRIETVAQLLKIRESAVADIRASRKPAGSQWAADRVRDIERCNRQLIRLGALPRS